MTDTLVSVIMAFFCRLAVHGMGGGMMTNTFDWLLVARGCASVIDRGENTLRVPSSQGCMLHLPKKRERRRPSRESGQKCERDSRKTLKGVTTGYGTLYVLYPRPGKKEGFPECRLLTQSRPLLIVNAFISPAPTLLHILYDLEERCFWGCEWMHFQPGAVFHISVNGKIKL